MIRRLFIVVSIIFIFGLFGCVKSNNNEENVSGEPKITNDSKQVDDFEVTINVEKDLNVYATITYIGEAAEKDIYHGGSIFFFNIYQQDGDFEYFGAMTQPLITTTLIQNEPHIVKFEGIEKLKLKTGTYEFEAIANFSLDSDDVLETKFEIPVSKITKPITFFITE
ncbi:hypothetical protein QT711_15215 [Sporosarcina saromensis]|uniref:Intracellular proteinase inhibitor n=1 Tax=Sporosarcina saromensis TaxID=359365 RepID=A0ABU4GG19_9BACL|nr:hypothetical protein [Sporosarcina saromensis]MDW0114547.1 hypothetical protein [Sporosarcina saromensis]